jgi:hypothetical protein
MACNKMQEGKKEAVKQTLALASSSQDLSG